MLYGLAILYVLLNAIDLLQTKRLLDVYGVDAEANFIVRAIYRRWDFVGVILFKGIMVGIAVGATLLLESVWLILGLVGLYTFAVLWNRAMLREDRELE